MIRNIFRITGSAVAACLAGFLAISIQSAHANPVLTPGVWKDISPQRSSGEVWYIRIDPSNPNTIYAPTGGAGLFKSTDAGSTWKQINVCPYIGGMEIDPKNSNHLYVGGWQNGDFWESTDGGDTWKKKPLPGSPDVGSFHVDPSDFNHILLSWHFIFDGNGSFIESTDGGNTWKAIFIPGVQGAPTKGVHFLYQPDLHIGNRNTWLITQENSGFYRTTDAGTTWTNVASGVTGTHGGLKTTYYTKDGVLYIGGNPCPVRSTDNGVTWERLCGNMNNSYYAAIVGDGNKVYVGGDGLASPVYSSSEKDGKTWTAVGATFNPGPGDMAFDTINRILYVAQRTPGLWALKVADPVTPVALGKPRQWNAVSSGMRVVPAGLRGLRSISGMVYDFRGKVIDRSKMNSQTLVAELGKR